MTNSTDAIRLAIPDETNLSEHVSPFDVPKSMTAIYHPNEDTFDILFQYISSEDIKMLTLPSGPRLSFGRNSHRIYSLSLPNASSLSSSLKYYLLSALTDLSNILHSSIPQQDWPESNNKIVRMLISANSPSLELFLMDSTSPICA